MEERLAAASVDHLRGWPAYHALTYGWLLSGLARAVTGHGHARADPRGGGPSARHRRPASGPPACGLTDQGRADPCAAERADQPGVQLRRAEGGRPAALRRVRRDVLPRHQILCAGRYSVPRRRGSGRQRCRHRPRPGQDVRRDRQRRQHRRRRSFCRRVDAGPDRKAEAVAGPEHRRADAVPPRLSRIADSRSAQGFWPHRPRRDARMGRSGSPAARSRSSTTGC